MLTTPKHHGKMCCKRMTTAAQKSAHFLSNFKTVETSPLLSRFSPTSPSAVDGFESAVTRNWLGSQASPKTDDVMKQIKMITIPSLKMTKQKTAEESPSKFSIVKITTTKRRV